VESSPATSYLAHIDNGIQQGIAVGLPFHEDLAQPWRPQFTFNVAGGNDVDEHPDLNDYHGVHVAGHGTHTAGIMAAGTSQASVPAGYPNPVPIVGGAGVCWYCNLMVAKVSRVVAQQISIDDMNDIPNAINWAVSSGAQVINLSLGSADHGCAAQPLDPYCVALSSANKLEVVIVAAAGNSDYHLGGSGFALGGSLDFPALSQYTIAAGGIQSYSGTRGNLWTEESPQFDLVGSSTGSGMPLSVFVKRVL
jgi:subtilisin family serine protease